MTSNCKAGLVSPKMAMDMMLQILNGKKPGSDFPFRAGPVIPVISKKNIQQYHYELLFGKAGFEPVYDYIP